MTNEPLTTQVIQEALRNCETPRDRYNVLRALLTAGLKVNVIRAAVEGLGLKDEDYFDPIRGCPCCGLPAREHKEKEPLK